LEQPLKRRSCMQISQRIGSAANRPIERTETANSAVPARSSASAFYVRALDSIATWRGEELSSDTLESINEVPVSVEDLLRVLEETQNLPKDRRSFEGRMHVAARLYQDDSEKAIAVAFRMRAMFELLGSEDGIPGWSLPRLPDGSIVTQDSVVAAAAVQPLGEVDGRIIFEREPFMAKILELADLEMRS
jgi:hypothetical protein